MKVTAQWFVSKILVVIASLEFTLQRASLNSELAPCLPFNLSNPSGFAHNMKSCRFGEIGGAFYRWCRLSQKAA